jgi:hypothetical protein
MLSSEGKKQCQFRGSQTGHASLWPREIFDLKKNGKLLAETIPFLSEKGVYILYKDEIPYYIGMTDDSLFTRICGHATNPAKKRYRFWNLFTAFAVPDKYERQELEAILIAAMPTANSAKPKLNKIRTPPQIRQLMRAMREEKVKGLSIS